MSEVNCDVCKHKEICRHYELARTKLHRLTGYTWLIQKKTWDLWITEMPDLCNHFEKEVVYDIRDKNGVIIGHKPLKIWYPNQNIGENKKPLCDCWYCAGGLGSKCYRKMYGDYSWKGISYKL